MPPPEYHDIGGLILNSGGGDWWCDLDVIPAPLWGNRETKGEPGLDPPHADGADPVDLQIAPITVTFLGPVYGDRDQDGAYVSGDEACRKQLADNLTVLMDLVGTRTTYSYHLYDRIYTAPVSILRLRPAEEGSGPGAIGVGLEVWFGTGKLLLAP